MLRDSIGLGNVGIFHHDLFSIPMLLNSSELMFETSRSALARAANTSKQITTTTTNIGLSPFLIYLFNRFRFEKLYPLTVLKSNCQIIEFRNCKGNLSDAGYGFLFHKFIRFYDHRVAKWWKNHVNVVNSCSG